MKFYFNVIVVRFSVKFAKKDVVYLRHPLLLLLLQLLMLLLLLCCDQMSENSYSMHACEPLISVVGLHGHCNGTIRPNTR